MRQIRAEIASKPARNRVIARKAKVVPSATAMKFYETILEFLQKPVAVAP
jgi:hypothetical protein